MRSTTHGASWYGNVLVPSATSRVYMVHDDRGRVACLYTPEDEPDQWYINVSKDAGVNFHQVAEAARAPISSLDALAVANEAILSVVPQVRHVLLGTVYEF